MPTLSGIKHERSQELIDFAYGFAKAAHYGQKRRYTGEPYITHPLAVAKLVASVTDDCQMICAALLHDVIEDTAATYTIIVNAGLQGPIARLVVELTDVSKPEDGNRAVRKALDCAHLSKASANAQTIKLADLIHNAESIVKHDPKFAKIFMKEVGLLLEVLREGDRRLYARLSSIVVYYQRTQSNS